MECPICGLDGQVPEGSREATEYLEENYICENIECEKHFQARYKLIEVVEV